MVVFPSWLPFFLQNPQNAIRNDKTQKKTHATTKYAAQTQKRGTQSAATKAARNAITRRQKNGNSAPFDWIFAMSL